MLGLSHCSINTSSIKQNTRACLLYCEVHLQVQTHLRYSQRGSSQSGGPNTEHMFLVCDWLSGRQPPWLNRLGLSGLRLASSSQLSHCFKLVHHCKLCYRSLIPMLILLTCVGQAVSRDIIILPILNTF